MSWHFPTFRLDYTNYFTFIDSKTGRCVICKRGHNKQKRNDLRQYSLALLASYALRMPLAWEVYEGNKNDKAEFGDFSGFVKQQLKKYRIDPSESTVIFDGGSNSEENLKGLGFHFICSASLAGHEELYEIDIDKYEAVETGEGHGRLAYPIGDIKLYGVDGKGILTFSQDLQDGQVAEMEKGIGQALEDLKEAHGLKAMKAEEYNAEVRRHNGQKAKGRKKKEKDIPEWDECNEMKEIVSGIVYKGRKSLKEYSEIAIACTGSVYKAELKIDEEKKGAYIKKYYGKKLTFTDQAELTTRQILEHYGEQECIETDVFRLSKNHRHFNMQPQCHWTDGKIKAQVSIVMISMIITEMLHREIEAAGIDVSTCRMLDVLSSIREGWLIYNGKEARRALEEMNEEQKALYDIVSRLK